MAFAFADAFDFSEPTTLRQTFFASSGPAASLSGSRFNIWVKKRVASRLIRLWLRLNSASSRRGLPDCAERGHKLINPLRRDNDHIGGRLARVVDGYKEKEDQTANRDEMQKRLPQEPLH